MKIPQPKRLRYLFTCCIVFVDNELSSWRYHEKDDAPSPYAKYIAGALPLPENSDIIIKRGYVIPFDKGMGSAYGGKWQPNPNKPQDQRFIGKPGEIKITFTSKGERFETKIG